MTDIAEKTRKKLGALGVHSPEAVAPLFAALREIFGAELPAATDITSWKKLRDRWQSRKQGLLTHVKTTGSSPLRPT